ncbi:MAG: SAM-dependent methyltransferase [Deltaproteobacteria bacterium]|nr:SAM-dependent methyltransferase [Deltaproteobacteria bacterium]
MFRDLKRVVYPVTDMEAAKQWFREVLKKEPAIDLPIAAIFQVGDSELVIAPSENEQQPKARHATAFWTVDDVDAAYQRLLKLGAGPHTEVHAVWHIKRASVLDPFGNVLGIIGQNPEASRRSVEQRASETAEGVAFLRALATVDPREEIRGRDYLAEKFLNEERARALHDPAARKELAKKRMAPGLYEYMLARTAFFDDLVEQAFKEQIPQVIFLGAGYDTRPYRFRDLSKETRMFELDIQTTQQRKKDLLQTADISIPENLTFIPINFKTDSLSNVLLEEGFRKTQKALFIWEGVTYYLPAEIVDQTLHAIRSISLPGSTIGFDYVSRFPEMMAAYGVKALYDIMKSQIAGEPADLFSIEQGKVDQFLAERGYNIIEHYSAADMERKYLTLRNGSLAGKMTGHVCFAHASMAG